MRIASISYTLNNTYTDPEAWLGRIGFYCNFLESMTDYAHVISFHCIGANDTRTRHGVTYVFLRRNIFQQAFPFGIHKRVRKYNPDALIVHGLIYAWQIILLRLHVGSSVKIIVQHHAERPFRGIRSLLQKIADGCIDAYLFSALELGQLWTARNLIGNEAKIHEFVAVSSAFKASDPHSYRMATGVQGHPVYLWVGRLDSNKDPVTVVKAFLNFKRVRREASLYLIFQGDELLPELKALLRAHPAESGEGIYLVGKVEHQSLEAWYNSAEFVISSSHYESGGAAICEAMSCGCIPVVTRIPSLDMMTGRGACGLTYEPGSESQLLTTLLASAELDIASEREKVLKQFEERLSLKAIARHLHRIISGQTKVL